LHEPHLPPVPKTGLHSHELILSPADADEENAQVDGNAGSLSTQAQSHSAADEPNEDYP